MEKKYFSQPTKKITKIITGVLVLMILSFLTGRVTAPSTYIDSRIIAPAVKAHQNLNKTFQFSIKNDQGQEITKITYIIQSADIQNDIIIKGQKASAIKGKTFLIINLKLTNPSDKTIQLNTRDYIRLTVNNNTDMLAAEVHNDPEQVQPIATKYTRLGFTINESDKKLTLNIGEINGKKTTIPLKLSTK